MFFQNVLKGKSEWYLYLIVLLLVSFGYVLGQVPMTMVLMRQMDKYPDIGMDAYLNFQQNPDFTLFHLPSNIGFILILLIFVFGMIALYIGIRWLHKRSFKSLVNWKEKIDWKRVLFGFSLWLMLTVIFEMIFYFLWPESYTFHMPGPSYFILFIIGISILPIQTSLEELLFRGYLMQALGFHTKNKWVALILTTILFTAVHTMNPEIEEYGLLNMLPYYLIAGFFLGYITIMDNRLELALGVHAATNFFGALFVSYEGAALQTESLFSSSEIQPLLLSLVFLFLAVIFIVIASRKFKWDSPGIVFNERTDTIEEVSSDEFV